MDAGRAGAVLVAAPVTRARAARAVLAGLAGTTAMTFTTALERSVRRNRELPVDYDATDHVVDVAAAVLRRRPRTPAQSRALFLLVHWGYGSAVGAGYAMLRPPGPPPSSADAAFYSVCQGMAFTLFPLLGGTPPPWRWRADVVVSSLAQHLVFVLAVAAASRSARSRR